MRTFSWLRVGLKPDFPPCAQAVLTCPGELTGFRPRVERAANSLACVSIHTAATDPCVTQENEVGKFSPVELRRATAKALRRIVSRTGVFKPFAPATRLARTDKRDRRHFIALLALALTACATPTVTRSCLTQQQYEQLKAAEPLKIHNKLTGKADEDTRPLAGSALELRSWGHALLATLKICSTP